MEGSRVPVQLDRPSNVLDGNLVLAHLVGNHAEKMHRVGMIRLDLRESAGRSARQSAAGRLDGAGWQSPMLRKSLPWNCRLRQTRRRPARPQYGVTWQKIRPTGYPFAVPTPRATMDIKLTGKSLPVAKRRGGHPFPQAGAQRGQSRQVAGQGNGQLHVLVQVAGNRLRQAHVGQVAERMPAGKGLAGTGDHRHAHPQRLAGRGAAGKGKGSSARSTWS